MSNSKNDKRGVTPAAILSVEQLLDAGEYQKAQAACEALLTEAQLPRKFWFCMARALQGLGDNGRAIEAYRREIAGLRRVPPDVLGNIGVLLGDIGQDVEGAVCLGESCALAPSPDRLVLFACALSRLGELDQAREILKRALDLEPANDEAWNNLGAYSLQLHAPAEAEEAFRRALAINPDRAASYAGLASAQLAQGRIEEALESAQKGLERHPLEGICHLLVGEAAALSGDQNRAEAAYLMAYRCDRTAAEAILGLTELLEGAGRIDEALDWYLRSLRAWPDDATLRARYLAFAEKHDCIDPQVVEMCRRCEAMQRREAAAESS